LVLTMFVSSANGYNILPVDGTPTFIPPEGAQRVGFIDVSGLGADSFVYESVLSIQLFSDFPVWEFHNTGMSSQLFMGNTLDGSIRCNIFSSGGAVTGSIVDNLAKYEISADENGKYVIVARPVGTLPQFSAPLRSEEYNSEALQEVPENLEDLSEQQTTIKLLLLWTRAAECANSGAPVGCTRTATTEANMLLKLQNEVFMTNLAHTNSGTGVTFDADIMREASGYVESGQMLRSLNDLEGRTDGNMDYIHTLR